MPGYPSDTQTNTVRIHLGMSLVAFYTCVLKTDVLLLFSKDSGRSCQPFTLLWVFLKL